MFSRFSFHVPRGRRATQTSEHSREGQDVFRTLRSNGLSIGQQRAAARIYVIEGLSNMQLALVSTDLMATFSISFCISRLFLPHFSERHKVQTLEKGKLSNAHGSICCLYDLSATEFPLSK